MTIAAILFDYGGTITKRGSESISGVLASIYGIGEEEAESNIWKPFCSLQRGEMTEEEFCSIIKGDFGNDPRCSVQNLFSRQKQCLEPDAGMMKIVRNLQSKGYVTALLSNTIRYHADLHRSRGDFDQFHPIILSCEVSMRKPESRIYRLACRKMGKRPEECVFIDDKAELLPPAKELGVNVILFETPGKLMKALARLGVSL